MPSTSLRTIHEEHASLAAVLHSLRLLLEQGPGDDDPAAFFDVMRAMLFYIDEFPERQHHPKESQWLFPKVAERAPETAAVIAQLEHDHDGGESAVRELQHLLLGWELMGAARGLCAGAGALRRLLPGAHAPGRDGGAARCAAAPSGRRLGGHGCGVCRQLQPPGARPAPGPGL